MLHVLDGSIGAASGVHGEHRRAIVTLCIGDAHRRVWSRMCRSSWLAYADRHGFDIMLITDPLDPSPLAQERSPAWQKCLILEQPWAAQYERIVWIDADIIISDRAPDIVAAAPDPARIGLCPLGAQLSAAELHIYLERFHNVGIAPAQVDLLWGMHTGNQFERAGIPPNEARMFNTGVLVLSPPHHAPLLRDAYQYAGPETGLFEQPILSRMIFAGGLQTSLSARFNWSMHEAMILRFAVPPQPPFTRRATQELLSFVMDEIQKAYFVHFCGCMPLLTLLADTLRPAPVTGLPDAEARLAEV